jgi:hypothetical protein
MWVVLNMKNKDSTIIIIINQNNFEKYAGLRL